MAKGKLASKKLSILDYLPTLIMQSRLVAVLHATTVIWKGKSWVANPFYRAPIILTLIVVTAYLTNSCTQFASVVSKDGWLNYIPSALLLTIEVASFFLGLSLFKHAEEVTSFLNSLILTETKTQTMDEDVSPKIESQKSDVQIPGVFKPTHKSMLGFVMAKAIAKDLRSGEMGRLVPYLAYLTQGAVPGIVCGFLLYSPCSLPIFIRASVTDCAVVRPSIIKLPDYFLVKLCAIFLDTFVLTYTLAQGSFAIAAVFSNGAICIADRLLRMRGNLNKLEKGSTPTNENQLVQVMSEYKSVKVFETMYNSINAEGIVPIILLDMFILATLSLYTCVALHSQIALPMLAMSAMVGGDTMILAQIIMYSVAGKVSSISTSFVSSRKRDPRFKTSKYVRRVVLSVAPLKIKVGTSGNYMEEMTPLNITQMTVDQATSLILVTKK